MMNKSDWQEDLVFSSQSKRKGFGYSSSPERSRDVRLRVRSVWGVFVLGIALILAKVLYLQVVEGGQHQLTSYSNHVELKRELAPRGVVYDRNGVALVENIHDNGKMIRRYPLGEAIAPVLGYISETKEEDLGCSEGMCYSSGMMVGRAGIERVMESILRGRDGGRLVEVDSAGREIREMGSNLAEQGTDLHLALDSRLQGVMYQVFEGRKGSAVVIDMQGKVIGLVSSPSYDPSHIQDYLTDTEQYYFLNRPIAATYPPGSVYKLVTALAGLSEGKITRDTEYEDTGEIKVGIYRYGNWYFDQYGKTEGLVNLTKALGRSNDIYFYKVGEELGIDHLVSWSRTFGLGQTTGIELPGEQDGLVPDQLWKERVTGEKWFLGNTYHMSIGQGDLLVTPLQVARMTLGAVSGRLCKISLLMDSAVGCRDLGLKTEDIEAVRDGMREACATGGTAFPFFESEPWVLCKTGTAQHSGQVEEEDLPHAWITVAYPGENPEMILTVMLESAGEGSAEAGPVAKAIIDAWKGMK
jgi:penicillin-binding protein 2